MGYLDGLFNLANKVIVITGAYGQLGRVFCQAFRDAGSRVIGLDCRIGSDSLPNVSYLEVDISNKKSVSECFKKVVSDYGQIDVLFNNAGVSTFEPFENRSEDKFDWIMGVNLKGTFFCIQEYVSLFDKYDWSKGAILNTASHFGVVSPDYRNYTDCDRRNPEVYGATKAGVIQMTRYFAVHLAERGIRVNALSPGGVYNPESPQGDDFIDNYAFRCPMGRMGDQDEMVGAALYLCSQAASYTTGQNIIIDGGVTCW